MLTILGILAYAMATFLKISANIAMPFFQQQFNLSTSFIGFISSIYFIPYAFLQLFAGAICKKIGPEKTIAFGLGLGVAGLLLFGFALGPVWIVAGRFLMGIGMGPIYVSLIFYLTQKYEKDKYISLTCFAMAAGGLASATAAAPLKILIQNFGVKNVFIIIALFSVAIAFSTYILRNKNIVYCKESSNIFAQTKKTVVYMFSNRYLVLGFLVWLLFVSIQMSYSGLWCTKWATVAFPTKVEFAGLFGTLYCIFATVGNLLGNGLNFYKNDNIKTTIADSLFFIIALEFLAITHVTGPIVLALFFACALGYFNGHLCIRAGVLCRQISSEEENASVMGVWNFAGSIGSFALQWGSGILLDLFGKTDYPYTYTHFVQAELFLLVIVGFLIIDKKKCR